jgi:hypothetical protein
MGWLRRTLSCLRRPTHAHASHGAAMTEVLFLRRRKPAFYFQTPLYGDGGIEDMAFAEQFDTTGAGKNHERRNFQQRSLADKGCLAFEWEFNSACRMT